MVSLQGPPPGLEPLGVAGPQDLEREGSAARHRGKRLQAALQGPGPRHRVLECHAGTRGQRKLAGLRRRSPKGREKLLGVAPQQVVSPGRALPSAVLSLPPQGHATLVRESLWLGRASKRSVPRHRPADGRRPAAVVPGRQTRGPGRSHSLQLVGLQKALIQPCAWFCSHLAIIACTLAFTKSGNGRRLASVGLLALAFSVAAVFALPASFQ